MHAKLFLQKQAFRDINTAVANCFLIGTYINSSSRVEDIYL